MQLQKNICLVTGASRGIGKSIALALGNAGGTVFGTATSSSGAESISEYLAASNIEGAGLKLNVTDNESIDEVVKEITNRVGAPEILVNNAGIIRDNLLLRMKEDDWDAILDTNLKSIYRVVKACIRPMTKARFGRIINISSVVGSTGNAGQANYAAAKAGMIGFTKSLAIELAARNIHVNAVAPGFIATDMTEGLSDVQKDKLLGNIPVGRLGTPEDIAQSVLFLVSPAADYITGQTLHVNGGMYMN
ncbi:MAG: 3-oxoacyl-[acyl-carrier protein] reductase [Parasphingorhabdus sp.]|jgi:3-oxoacyl-[acyl-carrier protein] reductase